MVVVQEWIDTCIAAHNAILGPVDFYVDRGTASGVDFSLSDFTRDSNWHDLDLSSLVPANTKQVWAVLAVRSTIIGRYCQFKNPDHPGNNNAAQITIQVASNFLVDDIHFQLDANRNVTYLFYSTGWTHIYLTIRGWIRPNL